MQNIQTKNKFDEIIEKMITENINGIDDSLYNLEHTEKISKVFKTVDSTGSFSKLDLSKKPKMDHLKSVITMLKDYVKVGEVKKKEAGEVMTPLELVKEMLATLPEDVWSNPNLKWLDSCNGSGPFLVMVIYKLMIGLKDWESDEEKRYKHIVENMIYAGELQPKNMFLYVSAIDPFDEYNLNIYTGSFLEGDFDKHMKTVWGLEKFSIILGNPPYNAPVSVDVKKGTTGNFIWDKFIMKSILKLSTNGYLNFVHPPGWRKPPSDKSKNKDIWNTISKLQIHYLEIHDIKDGLKTFGAGTRYDFYLIQNIPLYKETTIKSEDGKIQNIHLKDWSFIPNKCFDDIKKILKSDSDEVCPIMYDRTSYGADKSHVSRVMDITHYYPIIHATNKSGVRFVYSSVNNRGHFGIKKVIFGDSGINDVVIDINGEYGMSQHAMAISVDNLEEAENIKKALLSKKFKNIIESLSYSNFTVDWKMFSFFKRSFWEEFI